MIIIMIVAGYDSHSDNDCGVMSMMAIMYIMMMMMMIAMIVIIVIMMMVMMIKMMIDGGCDDHNYTNVDDLLC